MPRNGSVDRASKPNGRTVLNAFFQSVEVQTSDPVHLRLLKAAAKPDPGAALERELTRIVQEILDET